jgi:hypothetical protein
MQELDIVVLEMCNTELNKHKHKLFFSASPKAPTTLLFSALLDVLSREPSFITTRTVTVVHITTVYALTRSGSLSTTNSTDKCDLLTLALSAWKSNRRFSKRDRHQLRRRPLTDLFTDLLDTKGLFHILNVWKTRYTNKDPTISSIRVSTKGEGLEE